MICSCNLRLWNNYNNKWILFKRVDSINFNFHNNECFSITLKYLIWPIFPLLHFPSYYCQLLRKIEHTNWHDFSLLFPDFPRVNVGPENPLRVERDSQATLECNVDAKPKVTGVRWMRNSRFISPNYNHVIHRVSIQDAGELQSLIISYIIGFYSKEYIDRKRLGIF